MICEEPGSTALPECGLFPSSHFLVVPRWGREMALVMQDHRCSPLCL